MAYADTNAMGFLSLIVNMMSTTNVMTHASP